MNSLPHVSSLNRFTAKRQISPASSGKFGWKFCSRRVAYKKPCNHRRNAIGPAHLSLVVKPHNRAAYPILQAGGPTSCCGLRISSTILARATLLNLLLFLRAGASSSAAMPNTYVVVGGGVAGVTCCQTLASTLSNSQHDKVILVAASGLLKGVSNVVKLARFTDTFDVVEQVCP